jgi:uncharacterized membrane protein YjgN (DUF898 family)
VFLLLVLPAYVVLGAAAFANARGAHGTPSAMTAGLVIIFVTVYLYLLIPTALLRARLANLLFGGLRVGEHYVASNQRGGELLKLYFANALAVILSLGLLIPWAKIRLAKYRTEHLTLHARGPLRAEKLLDEEATALGEGLSDLGDFDIGIGV